MLVNWGWNSDNEDVTIDVTNTFATLQQKQTHRDKQIAKNLSLEGMEVTKEQQN